MQPAEKLTYKIANKTWVRKLLKAQAAAIWSLKKKYLQKSLEVCKIL